MKKFLLSLILVFTAFPLQAQNQVISKLKQPPPNKFGISDLWSIELNNTTRKDLKGYIVGSVSEDVNGQIVEGKTKSFTIKGGKHTYTQKDFTDADVNFYKNNYKESLLKTGGFPDGDYTICITVYNEFDEVIGIENCIQHSVRQTGNISLLTPADGEELGLEQPIIFSWTPLPNSNNYSLKIAELIGNQSPETALQQNPPFFVKENLSATQFQYPLTERKFQSEKSYAWIISSNGIFSDVGSFKVQSSNNNFTKRFTQYRFLVMYPNGEIDETQIENFEIELDEFARILIADDGIKMNPKMGTVPKQTQGATFGERVNSSLKNFFKEENNIEFGEDILILVGGIPTGKTVPCPPPGCGCTNEGGVDCRCKLWPGSSFCLCLLCPIINTMGFEDILPPPNNDNGIKTKDIVIILKNDTTEIDESFNHIVKLGLNKVAELRKNKVEALVIKQKYGKEVNNKNKTLRDVLVGITETILIEYDPGKFARLNTSDITVNEEGLEGLLGVFCVCDGNAVLCSGSQLNDCEKCCKTAKALEKDIVNIVNPGGSGNDPIVLEKIQQAVTRIYRGCVVGDGGVAR